MELIGWLGSVFLALCAVPLAFESFRNKHSNGVSGTFLAMWMAGELLTFAYVLPKLDYPLIFNYGLNIVCLLIIIYYKSNSHK